MDVLRRLVASNVLPDFNPRYIFAAIGLIVLSGGVGCAILSKEPVLPLQHATMWRTLIRPVEVTPYVRLTMIDAPLNNLSVSADGQSIWAVGNGGLILRSRDGGRTWTQIPLAPGLDATSTARKEIPIGSGLNFSAKIFADWSYFLKNRYSYDIVVTGVAGSNRQRAQQYGEALSKALVAAGFDPKHIRIATEIGTDEKVDARATFNLYSAAPNLAHICDMAVGVTLANSDASRQWLIAPGAATPRLLVLPASIQGIAPGSQCIGNATGNGRQGRRFDFEHIPVSPDTKMDGDGRLLIVGPKKSGMSAFVTQSDPVRFLPLPEGVIVNGGTIGNKDSTRWLVTADGRVLRAPLKADHWDETRLVDAGKKPERHALNAIYFTDNGTLGWIVGEGGIVYRSTDSGASWSQMESIKDGTSLRAIAFAEDGVNGWGGGDGGLYGSDDAGAHWSPMAIQPSLFGRWLHTSDKFLLASDKRPLRCASNYSACASFGGTIPMPPILAWVGFAAALFALGFAGVAPDNLRTPDTSGEGSAHAYSGDRPLRAGEADLLGFRSIAKGLAEFLNNRATIPPLSLAIDGPWGSGKSSLLNLFVEAEAPQKRFRLVWFNAWHHEKEENTLGAILQMVCREAIPAWYTPLGVIMRWNLLRQRIAEQPVVYLAMLFLLVLIFYAAWAQPDWTARRIAGGLQAAGCLLGCSKADTDEAAGLTGHTIAILPALGTLIAVVIAYLNFRVRLQSYATSASSFLPRLVLTKGRKDLMTDVGVRNRFAKEFASVTAALRPQRLVIVIDDLDRCQPEKVVEILQLINFLMTSGECFVLIAADLRWVEASVRESYGKLGGALIATEIDSPPRRNSEDDKLGEFANRYLRKIINVVIRVPRMSPDQSNRFVQEDDPQRPSENPRRASWFTRLAWVAALVAAIAVPIVLAARLPQLLPENPLPAQAAPVASRTPSSTTGTPDLKFYPAVTNGPAAENTGASAPSRTAVGAPGLPLSPWWLFLPVLIGLFFGVVAWQVWRVDIATRHTDSKLFKDALRLWAPVVYAASPTPRDLRRFMNQARYVSAQNSRGPAPLRDVELVKFAALEFVDPRWFDKLSPAKKQQLEQAMQHGDLKVLPSGWLPGLKAALADAYRHYLNSVPPAPTRLHAKSSIDQYKAFSGAIDFGLDERESG